MNTVNRRDFLAQSTALGGAFLLPFSRSAQAEPPPETTRIRISKYPIACIAPLFVAETLLRAEGFSQIDYVTAEYVPGQSAVGEGPGRADFDMDSIAAILTYIDAKQPVVTLSGIHLGCYELFGSKHVGTISELKGKRVPIDQLGGSKHVLLSSMAAYVGVDPKSIKWVVVPLDEGRRMYEAGEVDAYFGFPPEPQELRAKNIGNVIVNTATDKPWAQYFCCMLLTHSAFVRKYPIATKRVVRAMLKAADICMANPESVARTLMEKKLASKYEYALETLRDVQFDVWRTYDPENSLRFHANRLYEVGMIKSTPQQIISRGTDWRFLNELKKELKA